LGRLGLGVATPKSESTLSEWQSGELNAGLSKGLPQAFQAAIGMPDHFPFSYRIALLLGLMLVVSLVDWRLLAHPPMITLFTRQQSF
jgi:hypothetical protein